MNHAQYTTTYEDKKTLLLILACGGAVVFSMIIAILGHPALGLGALACMTIGAGFYARFSEHFAG